MNFSLKNSSFGILKTKKWKRRNFLKKKRKFLLAFKKQKNENVRHKDPKSSFNFFLKNNEKEARIRILLLGLKKTRKKNLLGKKRKKKTSSGFFIKKTRKIEEKGIGIFSVMCVTNDDALSNGSNCNNMMKKKKMLEEGKGKAKKKR